MRLALKKMVADRQVAVPVEGAAIPAMVADRPLEPSSKPVIENWVENGVVIGGLPPQLTPRLSLTLGTRRNYAGSGIA